MKFLVLCLFPLALAAPGADPGHSFHGYSHGRTYAHPVKAKPTYPKPVAYKEAVPVYHAPIVKEGPKCHTEYQTIETTECKTVYDKACATSSKTKYHTEYVDKCETIVNKKCYPTTRSVPDKKCDTHYKEVCTKDTEKIYDTTYEETCTDVVKKVCEEVAVHVPVVPVKAPAYYQKPVVLGYGRPYGYGRHYGGLRRYGRSAEPDAEPHGYHKTVPKCHDVVKPVCSKTPVKTPRYIEVPKCSKVPETVCVDIVREVPDTKCEDVAEEKCAKVPTQVAHEVPVEKCETVPREECIKVPKQVAKEVCKEYKH